MSNSTNESMLQLYTSFGNNPVWLIKIEGQEAISELSRYTLHLATQYPLEDAYNFIGKEISFGMNATENQAGRDFNGVMIRFTHNGNDSQLGWYYYEIEVVPWLWLLTQRSNCRIFPGNGQRSAVSVKQVLEELFKDYSNFKVDLSGIKTNTVTRDFWLQYNETDFHFFSRLVEVHGIFYYFSHTKDQHTLILGDQKQSYSSTTHQTTPAFAYSHGASQISAWKHGYQFVPGSWLLNSHNSDQPAMQLQASSVTCIQHKRSAVSEHYHSSAHYAQRDQGTSFSTFAIEAEEAHSKVVEGAGNIIALAVGEHLQLDAASFSQESEQDFVVIGLNFCAEEVNLPMLENKSTSYQNTFRCITASQVYRPKLTIDKPLVHQLHEAIVTGAANEEIHTDALHRLRVQFTWDREGKSDANASGWVRSVAHLEGVLRVGTPVLVGFLQNDMNQPIILGALYDAQQTPLFSEPTMSGIKMRRGINGDDSYYNELRFNDKKDAAEVFLHACKDMQVAVDHDLMTTIKNNSVQTIEQSRKIDIKQGDDCLTLSQGNMSITLSQGKCEITVQGDVTIKSKANLTFEAAQSLTLSGNDVMIKAQSTLSQTAANASIKANSALTLSGLTATVSGNASVALKGGVVEFN